MHRLTALISFYVPMAAYARGGHCYSSGCNRLKGQLILFALVVGGCCLVSKALVRARGAIEKLRCIPFSLTEFLRACKRVFTNL
ncbi:hypothetical protein BCh11DRAFT_06103 [Burkholderia sp. Ch1-1]|nr:hypothetical protein BCh11DRAFT_06103 [Burkholderia sp. Ch1-1]